MRLDPDHVKKLARAFTTTHEGGTSVNINIDFIATAMDRLNMWERGLLHRVLAKAASAKKLSPEQRVLLALFTHDGSGGHAAK